MFHPGIPIFKFRIIILILATSATPAISQDHVKIAFLQNPAPIEFGSTTLQIYDSNDGTIRIIFEDNSYPRRVVSKLVSHQPAGLFCWNAYSDIYKYFIQCYKQQGRNPPTFKYILPVLNVNYTPDDLNGFPAIYTLQMDTQGNNFFWSDPRAFHIWATSLATKRSKRIIHVEASSKSKLLLNIDDKNGYFFAAQFLHNFLCWGRIQDTATEGISRCILNHATIPFLTNIASDPPHRQLYISTSSGLFTAVYSVKELSAFRKLDLITDALQSKIIDVGYFDGYLFGIRYDMAMEVVNASSIRKKSYRVDRARKGFFSIFQDYRDGLPNPCLNLTCSHLCLPTHEGYKCACPSGFTLVQGNRCLPSVIVYVKTNSLTNSSTSNYVCQMPSQKSEDGVSEDESCAPEIIRSNLDTFSNLVSSLQSNSDKYFSIPDPYGVGLLQLDRSHNCIQAYTFATQAHSTLHCDPGRILFFGMDFLHSILFWVPSSEGADGGNVIMGSSFLLTKETFHNPVEALIAGFAVDPLQQRQYWLALPSTLVSSKYDGSNRAEIPVHPELPFSPSPMLQFYQNRLLWRRNSSTGSEIIALDLDTTVATSIRVADNSNDDIRHLVVLPVLEPNLFHVCQQSKCSHSCFPYSPTEFACGCPEPLKLTQNQCEGFQLYSLSGNQEGATVYQIQSASVPEMEIKTLSTGNQRPQNILFDIRNNQRDICFKVKGQSDVKCTTSDLRANIHPNTTMFIFDLAGQELFFNDGYLGNITLRSLRKNTAFSFKPFHSPNATAWALDTQKKIFFWSAEMNLHYVPLYNASQQGNVEIMAVSSPIDSITLDMFSRIVYFVQGQNLNCISYKDLFQNTSKGNSMWTTVYNLQHIPIWNLQFYEQALYWTIGSKNSATSIRYLDLGKPQERIFWASSENQTLAGFVLRLRERKYESQAYDPCTELPCSHFCFPVPPLEDSRCSYDCGCPEGMRLNGKRDCEDIPLPTSNTTFVAWVSVGAVLSVLLISGLVVALVIRSRRNVELNNLIDEIQNGNLPAASAASNQAKKAQYLPLTCIIPPPDLFVDTTKVLGDGAFGVVLQGVYLNSIVAVKSLKPTLHVNLDQLSEFAKEIKIMDYIGYHTNIVRFFGAEISNIKKGSMYAVLEFSRFGSLLSVLRKPSPDLQQAINMHFNEQPTPENEVEFVNLRPIDTKETPVLSTHLLLKWAEHIASGMNYLSEKGIVHGDLATRNVLVFDNNVAKISDFGLSRQLYNYANYTKKSKVPLPWRWMAIESLQAMEFSTKSDVWAYGVTLWEIFSFGHVPYPEQEWTLKFVELLRNGLTLPKPEAASQPLYDHAMKPCWALNPEQRPHFLQILETFKSIRQERAMESTDDYEFITAE